MNVKPGDKAKIIESTDGANVGRIVLVGQHQGEHSKFGDIWRIHSLDGKVLPTEHGGVGLECDCPDKWLKKEPPVSSDAINQKEAELAK